jgi:anti-anti-sigma regulatory factor
MVRRVQRGESIVMRIRSEAGSGLHVISVEGSFAGLPAGGFRAAAEAALASGAPLVRVEMAGADALDGSGVGALVHLHRRLDAQGRRLELAGLRGEPARLARLIGLDRAIACTGGEMQCRPGRRVARTGLAARLAARVAAALAPRRDAARV